VKDTTMTTDTANDSTGPETDTATVAHQHGYISDKDRY